MLEEENATLHQKVAQAKGSLLEGEYLSADSNLDAVVRPDSSKMRVRLDDSSQISKDKLPTSALSDVQNQRRHLSPV